MSNFRFEVANCSWLIEALDLDSVGSGLLKEVCELKCLHEIVSEGATECEGTLGGRGETLKLQLVLEISKDWGLEHQVYFLLTDDKWAVADLEAALGLGRDLELLRSKFDILVCTREHALGDHDLLVSRVLNGDDAAD